MLVRKGITVRYCAESLPTVQAVQFIYSQLPLPRLSKRFWPCTSSSRVRSVIASTGLHLLPLYTFLCSVVCLSTACHIRGSRLNR